MSKLKIQEYEIYYEVKGNMHAEETVVFLNGVMASSSSWHYQIKALEQHYRIICQDFKGQLLSDKPAGPYTFAQHAADVIALLDHLGLQKVHLAGTSYGGEVAMKLAILYPARVKTITVIDSVSELDELLKANIHHWKALAANAKTPQTKKEFFYGMLPSIYGASFVKEQRAMLDIRAEATSNMDDSYFEGQMQLYETFLTDVMMTDELHHITCPVLIVVGEDDYLKPVKFSRLIHEKIKGSEFVIVPNCGHVLIFEKYQELNTLLLGFIGKHA